METKGERGNVVVYVVVVIVIIAVVVIGYKIYSHQRMVASLPLTTTLNQSSVQSPSLLPSPTSSLNSGGLANKTETSNTQLDKDLNQIGNSMNKLDQDSSTINQDPSKASVDNPNQ